MRKPKIELQKSKFIDEDYYYLVIKAGNGRIMHISDSYNSKQAAQKGINVIKRIVKTAVTEDC